MTHDARFRDTVGRYIYRMIPFDHNQIHLGNSYLASYQNAALGNGSSDDLCITTPEGIYCHAVFSVAATGLGTFVLYEGPTVGAGTAVTPISRNRVYGSSTTVTAKRTAYTSGGTSLESYVIPGGTGPRAIGAIVGTREEFVLAANTVYCLRFTNSSGGDAIVDFLIEWYETTVLP